MGKWLNAPLIILTVILGIYGAVMVSVASQGYTLVATMIKKEYFGLIAGAVIACVVVAIDYRRFKTWWPGLMILVGVLTFLPKVPGFGVTVAGGTLWVGIGSHALFQPSEPAKLLAILAVASYIARYEGHITQLRDFLKAAGFACIPFLLIVIQGDLGTALVMIAVMLGVLLAGGARPKHLLTFIAVGVIAVAGVLWLNSALGTHPVSTKNADGTVTVTQDHYLIKNYQLDRLTVFVNPNADTGNAGYQLQQSKITIGAGQLTGAGLKGGTQTTLDFLPTRQTDFIFATLAEKLGFIGCMALFILYIALFFTSLSISSSSEDLFGTLIAIGIISMWLFQVLQNVGMTMGLMPITGIPLPFMSYGTTALMMNLMCVGFLGSIWAHRPYQAATKGTIRRGITYQNR